MAIGIFKRNKNLIMGKIIIPSEISAISEITHEDNKKIVLVGGCFDILHVGHIRFLEAAKEIGDILFVEVESDTHIHKLKGKNRPINSQVDRAEVLSHLIMVDYVILLPDYMTNQIYLDITQNIRPDFLATTKGDPKNMYLYKQARTMGITVKEVVPYLPEISSSKIISSLGLD